MASRFGVKFEGGVPVFHPTYEEFRDFKNFISEIEPMGMQSGVVKVVPPEEWLDQLPAHDEELVSSIRIKNPIQQEAAGNHGVFCFKNIQKGRTYDIKSWHKTCYDISNQPPAGRGQRRGGTAESAREHVYDFDDAAFTPERCEVLEKAYWKTLGFNTPMYGADMPGSLFDDSVKDWNVANLDSVLSNLNVKIPGVNTAYLYCGMWKATFAWHLEDMDLHSINYIHFGAPKQWYSIPQSDRDKFYDFMRRQWPLEQRRCKEFLRHKTFLVSPALLESYGIKVNKVVHRQREFMITFPYGYHAGFNYGYNVAESVNFATEAWLEIGKESDRCRCINDSVGIDVARLIRTINGEPEPEIDIFNDENEQLMTPPSEGEYARQLPKAKKRKSHKAEITVSSKPNRQGECVLCPHAWDGCYVVNDAKTAKAHRICAQFIPECWLEDDVVHGLENIEKERFGLRCIACRSSVGACFQCSHPTCTRSFHATCAASAGVVTSENTYLCRQHRPKPLVPWELDPATVDLAASLLVGDTVQCRIPSGRTFAGVVEENNLDEGTLLVKCHPNMDDVLEAPHGHVIPGRLEPIGLDAAPQVKTRAGLKPADGHPSECKQGTSVAGNNTVRRADVGSDISAYLHHPTGAIDLKDLALPKPVFRPELYSQPSSDSGSSESPFMFMGVPLPTCLSRDTPL